MDRSRRHDGSHPLPALSNLTMLGDVRTELAEIESLERRVSDLMTALRARLTPEHFQLAWALRDAVECHAVAEGLLRDRVLATHLAREFPARSAAQGAIRRRLLADVLPVDEAR
jgi:hypothetical protein